MTQYKKGDKVDVTITYLEMVRRPDAAPSPKPANVNAVLLRSRDCSVRWFLYHYDLVGENFEWLDRHKQDPEALQAYVDDPAVELYSLMLDGEPAGFFQIDRRDADCTDLAYFGLAERAIGRGLGKWLLDTAIRTAWEGAHKISVNTCTLDHPRALPLYQKAGFRPVRQERKSAILSMDREVPMALAVVA